MTLSKKNDAEAMNTVGEGEDTANFAVGDPKGEWFVNSGKFPMIDTESSTRFEAGVPTLATRTEWVNNQIEAGSLDEAEAPDGAKGKAVKDVTPSVDETPKSDDTSAGNGMQSAVQGS